MYIYIISIYTHQKNAFMCMFMFSSFSILLLLTATSWPGDIGCCGNGGNRDREGREGAFSLFCGVLGKDVFFPSTCLSRRKPKQGDTICNTRCYRFGEFVAMKLKMLLECGVCLPLV